MEIRYSTGCFHLTKNKTIRSEHKSTHFCKAKKKELSVMPAYAKMASRFGCTCTNEVLLVSYPALVVNLLFIHFHANHFSANVSKIGEKTKNEQKTNKQYAVFLSKLFDV